MHRALELLLDRPPDERTLDAGLADLARARIELAPHPEFADLDLTDEEWAKFDADAEALVQKYFQLEDPRTVRPIGLELKLEAHLGPTRLAASSTGSSSTRTASSWSPTTRPARCRRSSGRPRA